ncbi:Oviduct-specific glycoprotein [Fusarium oxysporum f. sp. albedinis]|nr:Oviduct-specific glycoprotein [Fusarium oxysporum f. sp. albedinis]
MPTCISVLGRVHSQIECPCHFFPGSGVQIIHGLILGLTLALSVTTGFDLYTLLGTCQKHWESMIRERFGVYIVTPIIKTKP